MLNFNKINLIIIVHFKLNNKIKEKFQNFKLFLTNKKAHNMYMKIMHSKNNNFVCKIIKKVKI